MLTWSDPLYSGIGQGRFCCPFVLGMQGAGTAGEPAGQGDEIIFSSDPFLSGIEKVIGRGGCVLSKSSRKGEWGGAEISSSALFSGSEEVMIALSVG